MNRIPVIILLFILIAGSTVWGASQSELSLKILTINIWSGVDYKGIWRFGEYESAEQRERRFLVLVEQIQTLDPDIIFIQEENFLNRYVKRLADTLSYVDITQVVNAGIKIGTLGPPVNFKEGKAILARPSLRLDKVDAWKLSGSPGIQSAGLTVHFDETVIALVGKIFVDDVPFYLVNVHLHASPPEDPAIVRIIEEIREEGFINDEEFRQLMASWRKGTKRRQREMDRLLVHLDRLSAGTPVIVAGDFNAIPLSPEMELFRIQGGYIDTYEYGVKNREYTWDPMNNPNGEYSTLTMLQSFGNIRAGELLTIAGDRLQRRIDYIFLNGLFTSDNILYSAVVIDSPVNDIFASDHFGIFAEVDITDIVKENRNKNHVGNLSVRARNEFLPILVYDTDIGFGYGGKAFFLNPFGRKESFDAIAFNSTKGESWYRFVFSVPDREIRQRKIYPLAFDLIVDYQKQINKNFFGIGNLSRYEDRERYMREEFEIRSIFSKGFSEKFIMQTTIGYSSLYNGEFPEMSSLAGLSPLLNRGTVRYYSIGTDLRFDSRDSYVNPSRGIVMRGEMEFAPGLWINNVEFVRTSAWLQYYKVLFYPRTVLALRVGQKSVFGDDLPIQVLTSLGGAHTLRGYPANRFLDKVAFISNAEVRFPLYRRLGGVAGIDAGAVSGNAADIFSSKIHTNTVFGLRYQMYTFIVRLDVGFGKDTRGLYFNFGQLF